MKNLKFLLALFSSLSIFISCSKNDSATNDTKPVVSIAAKTTYTGTRTNKAAATIALSSFKVNLSSIKFEFEDESHGTHNGNDDDHNGFFDEHEDVKLKGPFELDILSGQANIVATNIPQAAYDKIEFKLSRNTNTSSPIFNKTIEIRGTINGTPFVFWHNFEESVDISFANAANNVIINQDSITILFNFNLDVALANVDLSTAHDGNGDGTIEISPIDNDGNQALANILKDKIENATEIEGHDDDHDDHGNDGGGHD